MTTQTAATAEIEKLFRLRIRFFSKFLTPGRIRARRKNAESSRSRLRLSGSGPTSGIWHL